MKKGKQSEIIEVGINQEVDNVKKTKRNRKPTACKDLRNRYDSCGCCGSLNVVEQGVIYCKVCNQEEEFLRPFTFYDKDSLPYLCDCSIKILVGKRFYFDSSKDLYSVLKCLDCGAVASNFCPNCKGKRTFHKCWKHWTGKYYCKNCGYRK